MIHTVKPMTCMALHWLVSVTMHFVTKAMPIYILIELLCYILKICLICYTGSISHECNLYPQGWMHTCIPQEKSNP